MNPDLNTKIKKYLVITFILQVSLGVDLLVVYNLVQTGFLNISVQGLLVFHVMLMFGAMSVAYYTTCLFFKKKSSKVIYGILTLLAFFTTGLAGNPSWHGTLLSDTLFLLSAVLLLLNISVWFIIIVKDIFFNPHDLTYRIWGAANIYWILTVIFAYLYFLFELAFPGSFGFDVFSKTDFLNHAFKLSLHSMVSIDHHYDRLSLPMENFSLLQATMSHLFIVFIVGRLLTK